MKSSGDADVHVIPLFGIDQADLKGLGASALPVESRLEPRAATRGVNMDTATMAVAVPAVASIVAATISAIATIWVAKINARAKTDSEPARPAKVHAVEIVTFSTSVLIPVGDDFESSLASRLPATRSITAIRLVSGA